MEISCDPIVKEVFDNYPKLVKEQLMKIRKHIIDTAKGIEGLLKLEETLKWGEPSYLTKHGSTIRLGWSPKNPEQYGIYFQCTSRLVPTFRTIYKNRFQFEGNRAILFNLNEKIPVDELKHCITLALNYHKVKHQPLLGA